MRRFSLVRNLLARLLRPAHRWLSKFSDERIQAGAEMQKMLLGQIRIHQLATISAEDIKLAEVKVFSQGGEDGIIQKIIQFLPGIPTRFIEFGVHDYQESNTRFLLMNNNWEGLVMDGSKKNIQSIREQEIYWKHMLKAKAAFITRDNIQSLLLAENLKNDVGLLSIDIDGNDYWVWEALEIDPWIVVCEYNSWFGPTGIYSVPYEKEFFITQGHYSNLYYGASLGALCSLAQKKGYVFVGCNTLGTNAFFVRRDKASAFREHEPMEGYVRSTVRQSRHPNGELAFLSYDEARKLIAHMPVYDFSKQKIISFGEAEGICQ